MPIQHNGAPLNIANGVREFGVASPDAVAILDGDRSVTYDELDDRSNRLASLLLASGLEPGAHVALLSANRAEYAEAAVGIAKAGMVMIPLNPRSATPELEFILGHSDAAALIVEDELVTGVAPALDTHGIDRVWSLDGDSLGPSYEGALVAASPGDPRVAVDESTPFAIAYTSGTTGDPKGVVISHRSRTLTFYCAALEWGLGPGRRTIAVAPMYHGAGFAFAFAALHTGGTCSMLRSFDPERLLTMIEADRPHSIFLVPAHAVFLRQLGDEAIRRRDSSSLQTLYFDAAPLPQQLKEWVHQLWPNVGLHELYGSTEAGIVSDLRPDRIMEKERCVGPPWFMTEVRVVDDKGDPVPRGEIGELFSRSPFLMNGYHKNPEATEAATTDDGFFSAGDLATLDEDNCIYIVDRKKDMIITGGVNVYPREVEEVLITHPDVADVAVVGVPDDTWGERIAAVMVLRAGGELDAPALDRVCRSRLAGYKVPRDYRVIDVLPRNAGGKVVKSDLRRWLSAGD